MLYEKYNICNTKTKFLVFVCLSVAIVASLSLGTYFSSASAQNMTKKKMMLLRRANRSAAFHLHRKSSKEIPC